MTHQLSVEIFDEHLSDQTPNLHIYTINKIIILRIHIINTFHDNIIHHNRRLILITSRKSLFFSVGQGSTSYPSNF